MSSTKPRRSPNRAVHALGKPAARQARRAATGRGAQPSSGSRVVEDNVRVVGQLEDASRGSASWAERAGDRVASFAGTMYFIGAHALFFAAWILANAGLVPGFAPFDPYPFTFLTFCVSLEAIFLTSIVLISQKRLGRLADERAHLDLQINLLAEQESTETLRLVRALCEHTGAAVKADAAIASALAEPTRPSAVAKAVKRHLEQQHDK